jgi:hypothetical protein
MITKLSILICVALLACAAIPAADGAGVPSASRWNPDETAPTVDDVAAAAAHARAMHCRASSCQAIIVIHELLDIEKYKIDNDIEGPNGVVLLRPGNWPKIANRRLNRTLLDHPELYGSVCAMGVKLVSRIHLDLATGEIFIPVILLQHSVDMDLRDHGHCARDLVAALPRDPTNDLIRINAQSACVNDNEYQYRPKAACAVLAEGVKEKQ